jgi:hypothetical protein
MRDGRLKLVGPEDTLSAATDSSADAFVVVTTQDAPVRALRGIGSDEGQLPDDAA